MIRLSGMTTAEIAAKLDSLEARAARYVGTPGPAGEVQQRAQAVIADHMVSHYRRDGRAHLWQIEARSGHIVVVFSRSEAEQAVAA